MQKRLLFFDFPLIIIIIMKTNKYFPFNIIIIMCYMLMLQKANHRFTGFTFVPYQLQCSDDDPCLCSLQMYPVAFHAHFTIL